MARKRKLTVSITVSDQHAEAPSVADLQEWLQWITQSDEAAEHIGLLAADASAVRVTQLRVLDDTDLGAAPDWTFTATDGVVEAGDA